MTVEYLLELRFQELPPKLLRRASRRLSARLVEDLVARGLTPGEVITGLTPRRLMVCLQGLPAVEADSEVPARPLRVALEEIVPRALDELPGWPSPAAGGGVRGILSLLDGEILPLALAGVAAGACTAGHPRLSPQPFTVSSLADYQRQLRELGIEVIAEARRAALEASLARRAAELGGELAGEEGLLERLTDACEIPGVVDGGFDPELTALPEEVILAVLGSRLDAFALRGEGCLLPCFLTVMDRFGDPVGWVKAGQERTAAGRLIDARFRHRADRRLTLVERSRRLEDLDFHPRLGSYAAKAGRITELVELVCGELGWPDVLAPASTAAALSKADLTSGTVRDHPSLRGTIGGIQARDEGYPEVVWRAIYQHYRSRPIPQHRAGRALAVADRLDSLVGLFGVGQAPNGSRDPFGLRRLARGMLRIIVDGGMELDLDLMAARAVLLYGEVLDRGAEDLLRELQAFLSERFRHFLGQRGFAPDEIEAAEAIGIRNLPDLVARVAALKTVREDEGFRSLVVAAKRILNMVKDSPELELRPEQLAAGAEQDLHDALGPVRAAVDRAAAERRYEDSLRSMAALVPHLDRFFADVLVMDEDEGLRANRVALLQACRRVFWRIARLKVMVVETGPERSAA